MALRREEGGLPRGPARNPVGESHVPASQIPARDQKVPELVSEADHDLVWGLGFGVEDLGLVWG